MYRLFILCLLLFGLAFARAQGFTPPSDYRSGMHAQLAYLCSESRAYAAKAHNPAAGDRAYNAVELWCSCVPDRLEQLGADASTPEAWAALEQATRICQGTQLRESIIAKCRSGADTEAQGGVYCVCLGAKLSRMSAEQLLLEVQRLHSEAIIDAKAQGETRVRTPESVAIRHLGARCEGVK